MKCRRFEDAEFTFSHHGYFKIGERAKGPLSRWEEKEILIDFEFDFLLALNAGAKWLKKSQDILLWCAKIQGFFYIYFFAKIAHINSPMNDARITARFHERESEMANLRIRVERNEGIFTVREKETLPWAFSCLICLSLCRNIASTNTWSWKSISQSFF